MCRPLNLSIIMLALGGKSDRLFLDVERSISLKGGPRRGSHPLLAARLRDEMIQLQAPLACPAD